MIRKAVLPFVLAVTLATVACSTTWVAEAVNILKVVAPAAVNILTLVAAFEGTPVDVQKSQTITNDVNAALKYLQDYSAASAAAGPGVLAQLDGALSATQNDLSSILATLHVVDKAHAAQIQALVTFVISEVAQVQSLIPPPPSTVIPIARRTIPLSARKFKSSFNAMIKPADASLVLK